MIQTSQFKKEKAGLLLKDLEKALHRLVEASEQPPTVFNQDSTIQRFEFTFEAAWKLMKTIAELEGLDAPSPKRAIRQSAVLELINDPDKWFEFLDNRNLTVHTYKEEIAQKVYNSAKEFIPYTEKLVEKISNYLITDKPTN
ncbi:hypothetical protein A2960_02245 [Candidatus Gottesmanbacteria bacterium RIFCSPLOWO2_01_FULL_39_12b]|uniref:Nucleotidyltransferase n=1 Tax=Candidatus Gottesmanbacteria bacterium RIFCSPLOWO2_01_FULL_39_12b TaxID=1798388 RepID=A0A1F6AQH3_9BACT|nr:MAG: hypothetical protein A2960_02245 [Candidatus Gottesmanbacteria bacterium RIFCSPLOWO2_01_FULL_39_12b]